MEVEKLSHGYTRIISIDEIKENPSLYWGGNGVGDRWAKKKFNYTVIRNNKTHTYSENEDEVPYDVLHSFRETNKGKGIIGIYVHSMRTNIQKRPIRADIRNTIINRECVVCGSKSDIICDHKNDLYNDLRVLQLDTQVLSDFQSLCNHCNLQKRQICKEERESGELYSAKRIPRLQCYPFEFTWEKKAFDVNDINCKTDTYWFDPVAFEHKIYCYLRN